MSSSRAALLALLSCATSCATTTRTRPEPPPRASRASAPAPRAEAPPRDPAPVALAAPAEPALAVEPALEPTRWQLSNGLTVEHRAFAGSAVVHLRLVVRGAGRSLADALRLAAALERGATRRNPGPLFLDAVEQLGAELRADVGRHGLVLSLDVSAQHGREALRRLGELALERAPSRDALTAREWFATRLGPAGEVGEDALTSALARRAVVERLRVAEGPWSPREWSEVAPRFAWSSGEDSVSTGLAREAFRGGALTLVVSGDIGLDETRALVGERWAQIPRGTGAPAAPLAAVEAQAEGESLASWTLSDRVAVSVAWRFGARDSAARSASWLLLSSVIDRCPNGAVSRALSRYDDPERAVLALSASVEAERVARAASALGDEPARVLGDRCFEREFFAARTALVRERSAWDARRWADQRAWDAHDAITGDARRALLESLVAATPASVRAELSTALSTAARAVAVAGPADVAGSLCAVRGVRSVRRAAGAPISCASEGRSR
jgi:hypothetical protein